MSYPNRLHNLITAFEILLEPEIGIIQYVQENPFRTGDPRLYRYGAKACNTAAFTATANSVVGAGAATTRPMAMAKAVGEAVERYCSAIYDPDSFPLTSYQKAPFRCVPPQTFATYTAAQCAEPLHHYQPFTATTPQHWCPVQAVSTGATWHVPAVYVYVPYYYQAGETPIVQAISTGLACHSSQAEALLSGLCEVVERDAFMLTWQAQVSPPHINPDSLNAENQALLQEFLSVGRTVYLLNITQDNGIPTILGIQTTENPHLPALSAAGATAPSPQAAVQKCLEELALTAAYMRNTLHALTAEQRASDYRQELDKDAHMRYWCQHRHLSHIKFLYASQQQMDLQALPDLTQATPAVEVAELVRRVEATGYQVLAVDLTTADIQQCGLYVVRVIVPGYHPLTFGYQHRVLGGQRLWTIPQQLGYSGITPDGGDNPYLHPYP